VKLLPEEKKAIEARPTHDPQAYQLYLLGRYYHTLRGRNLDIALRFYRRALEIDPNYEVGRYEEALAAHEESVRLEPDSFDVHANFGRTSFMLGRHEAAIEHDERAAQILDTDYLALNLVTMSYMALGRQGEAESAGRRALERIEKEMGLHPYNSDAVVAGAIVLARLGEKERAKEWASRALIIDPDDAMDHYNLSCALAQMNEPDQAVDALESCLQKMSAEMINWVKQDSDFIPLHGHPRFQALIARGEARLAAVLAEQAAKSSSAPVPGKST
jgi:adenylate cyclase